MKVIIKKTGEIKDVAFGHAVNYLIPQGKAVLATEEKLEEIKEEKNKREEERKKQEKQNQKLAIKLEGKKVKIKKKAGKGGKLFGSVSEKDIKKALGQKEIEVLLEESIKETGEYNIELKIGQESANIKIEVEAVEE